MKVGGPESGLTLVEMLVVLAIVGVAAGAVALGLGALGREANVQAEAQRLATALRLAQDESLVTDSPAAFQWDAVGYRFAGVAPAGALEPHRLPRGVRFVGTPVAGSVALGGEDGSPPFAARLQGGAERWRVTYDGLSVDVLREPAA